MGLFGRVNVHTGDFFCQPASQYKTADFHRVLMTILERYEGKRAILIMDNARIHKAEELQPFFEANRERLFCIDLPPYSPTLNPVERMWKWLKEVVIANRFHPTQASIAQARKHGKGIVAHCKRSFIEFLIAIYIGSFFIIYSID